MSDTPGAAGWQPDPTGRHDHRYWDGSQWTDNVADAGVASTDPYLAAAEPPAAPDPSPTAPTDPTVAEPFAPMPTADPTAAWSSGGPPPPAPIAPAGAEPEGGGGGSKKGLLIGGAIVAVVLLVVAALVLSGGNDDDVQTKLAGGDGSTTTTESIGGTVTTESTDETSSGSTDSGVDYSTYKDVIVSSLTQAGLDDDQADCLADKLIDAMESGEISEDQILQKYQEFFSDCDIDPNDFGN